MLSIINWKYITGRRQRWKESIGNTAQIYLIIILYPLLLSLYRKTNDIGVTNRQLTRQPRQEKFWRRKEKWKKDQMVNT